MNQTNQLTLSPCGMAIWDTSSNIFLLPYSEADLVVTSKVGWPPPASPIPHPEWIHVCVDCALLFFAVVMCLSAASIAFSAWKDRKRT